IAQKYDMQKEEELRYWIEEVTGMPIGENFQKGLKDGVILCELSSSFHVYFFTSFFLPLPQLENLGNFIKAILAYGLKPNDIFEANDLFENGNMTQVQTTLLALASMAKTKGMDTKIDIGVKYADRQMRNFDEEKMKAGQCVIGLQMGTNKCASQAGMTAYGTRRHLYDPKMQTDKPYDQTTISLQMGTNKGASQAGMPAPGTRRDIYDQKVALQPMDSTTISLQMGTNKVASQKGMSVYGLGRQVYDPKYCPPPQDPTIHTNGSQGTGTNGSEISDSDYQAEYPDEYHGGYQDEYGGHYDDQGVDY
ncbi:calponin-3-like, partial [Scleropages formosus]